MLGFVAIMMAEAGSKTPALESFGGDVLGVVLLSITLTLATIFPKFASGSSLKVRARGGGCAALPPMPPPKRQRGLIACRRLPADMPPPHAPLPSPLPPRTCTPPRRGPT